MNTNNFLNHTTINPEPDNPNIILSNPKLIEKINHPKHYNEHPSKVECIDIVEHFNFNLGNAIKYIWRAGLKSENLIEDLKKAIWYLNREIEKIEKFSKNLKKKPSLIPPSERLADQI